MTCECSPQPPRKLSRLKLEPPPSMTLWPWSSSSPWLFDEVAKADVPTASAVRTMAVARSFERMGTPVLRGKEQALCQRLHSCRGPAFSLGCAIRSRGVGRRLSTPLTIRGRSGGALSSSLTPCTVRSVTQPVLPHQLVEGRARDAELPARARDVVARLGPGPHDALALGGAHRVAQLGAGRRARLRRLQVEVAGADARALGQHARPLHAVLELAHVPRPGVARHRGHGVGAETLE